MSTHTTPNEGERGTSRRTRRAWDLRAHRNFCALVLFCTAVVRASGVNAQSTGGCAADICGEATPGSSPAARGDDSGESPAELSSPAVRRAAPTSACTSVGPLDYNGGMGTEFICVPIENACDYTVRCVATFPGVPVDGAPEREHFVRRHSTSTCSGLIDMTGFYASYDAPAPRSTISVYCRPACDIANGFVDDGLGCSCDRGLEEHDGECYPECPDGYFRDVSNSSICRRNGAVAEPRATTPELSEDTDGAEHATAVERESEAERRDRVRREEGERRAAAWRARAEAREAEGRSWDETIGETMLAAGAVREARGSGSDSYYRGESWEVQWTIAAGLVGVPVISRTIASAGSESIVTTRGDVAISTALATRLRITPYRTNWWEFTGFAEASVGYNLFAGGGGSTMTVGGGLAGFLGFFGNGRSGFVAQVAGYGRRAQVSSDYVSPSGSGSVTGGGEGFMSILRAGGGVRFCISSHFEPHTPEGCNLHLQIEAFADVPTAGASRTTPAVVFRVELWSANSIHLGVEGTWDYPYATNLGPIFVGPSAYIAAAVGYSFDWFGMPYDQNSPESLDARGDESRSPDSWAADPPVVDPSAESYSSGDMDFSIAPDGTETAGGAVARVPDAIPTEPTREQVLLAVEQLATVVRECGRAGGMDRVSVVIVFAGPTGDAVSYAFPNAPDDVSACIAAGAPPVHVPPFDRAEFSVRMPFLTR